MGHVWPYACDVLLQHEHMHRTPLQSMHTQNKSLHNALGIVPSIWEEGAVQALHNLSLIHI